MLGDAVFSGEPSPAQQLLDAAQALGTAVIGLEEVAADKVDRYGIVAGESAGAGVVKISAMIEKPTPASVAQQVGDRGAVRVDAGNFRLPGPDSARRRR